MSDALGWAVLLGVCLVAAIIDALLTRRARAPKVQTDVTGRPFPDVRDHAARCRVYRQGWPDPYYCRDCGRHAAVHDDDDLADIATERLGGGDPWPGIEAINAVRAANPKLTDMHAYAVAKARKRLAVR